MYWLVSTRPNIIPFQNPNFIKYFNPICNFRLLIILFLCVLRLHVGIDLRGQVNRVLGTVDRWFSDCLVFWSWLVRSLHHQSRSPPNRSYHPIRRSGQLGSHHKVKKLKWAAYYIILMLDHVHEFQIVEKWTNLSMLRIVILDQSFLFYNKRHVKRLAQPIVNIDNCKQYQHNVFLLNHSEFQTLYKWANLVWRGALLGGCESSS